MIGKKLAHYEITSHLGTGGMGEVYQATDAKLGRSVAIKLLPEAFTHDHDRASRFEREARVLASLNHPNIAAIHGLEESDGRKFLVMELVSGETLAERIRRGPIPIDEALPIAKQIAAGLEAAHEKGIIHRDLKPANIKITPQGQAKVLDFGLAKAFAGETVESNLSNSPTMSMAATRAGVILGTAAYMSPEQAKGKETDRTTDIWAFGCVLYEMLTGRASFEGEDLSEILAAVLRAEPEWERLPSDTPESIRRLLRRCLRKERKQRLQYIGDARIEIEEAPSDSETPLRVAPSSIPSSRRELAAWAVALAFVLATAGLMLRLHFQTEPDVRTVLFDVSPPEGGRIALGQPLSPDGKKVAFVATVEGKSLIWVRHLDSSALQPLPGTEDATRIFWSADSEYIGFFAADRLRKVPVTGGMPQVICNEPGRDGAWSKENVILIGGKNGPILRVPAVGGQPVPVTELNASLKETTHDYPDFLPDGRHFLYMARSSGPSAAYSVYVGSLDSKERHPLAGIHSGTRYSPTGHVLFLRGDSTLMAQPFDSKSLTLSGEAFPVAEVVQGGVTASFSISSNGSVAYLSGTSADSQLGWFDRHGVQLSSVGPKGRYSSPELSPDGKFVAFRRGEGTGLLEAGPGDIWIMDIQKGIASRFTFHPAGEFFPIWSQPDGQTIVFASDRDGARSLYARTNGAVGEDQLLLKGGSPSDWSRDGRFVAYISDNDVWVLPITGDRKPIRVTESRFPKSGARISPDGLWIAYSSNETVRNRSGEGEVYVQPFLRPGIKQQVSTAGGLVPRWRRDSKELYYVAPDFTFMAASIKVMGSSLEVGAPARLFQKSGILSSVPTRIYDVSADGHFLVNVPSSEQSLPHITVILNWKPKS